jgi:O-antigen/teichoic acid export membrane protein
VAVLATGTGVSQAIALLATPLLTRLYTPDEFGVLAVFAAVAGLIAVVAALRYEMAIPLARRTLAAVQTAGLAMVSVTVTTVVVATVGYLVGPQILAGTRLGTLTPYLALLPVAVFLAGAYEIFTYWAVRARAYEAIAISRLQQSTVTIAAQAAAGPVGFGAAGLIGGQIGGQLAGLVGLALRSRAAFPLAFGRVTRRGMAWSARRYRRFALYDTWASLLNAAGAHVPAVLFAALSGVRLAGFYLLALRLLSAPSVLVGKSVSQVMFPVAVRQRGTKDLANLVLRTQQGLSILAFPPFLVFAALAPAMFGWLFGAEWAEAGRIAAWTALWVALQFVYSPLSVVLLAVEAQGTNLALQSVSFVSRSLAIAVGFAWGDAMTAVVAYTCTSATFYVLAILVVASKAGLGAWASLLELVRQLLIAAAIALPTFLTKSGPLWLTLLAVIGPLSWAAWRAVRLFPAMSREALA